MHIKFKTSQLLEDDAECDLQGYVTVDVPSYSERQMFVMKAGYTDYKAAPGDSDEAKLQNATKLIEINCNASNSVLGRVIDCDLRSEDGEIVLKTREEFEFHPACGPLIEGLMTKFLSNFSGKKKMPSPSSK